VPVFADVLTALSFQPPGRCPMLRPIEKEWPMKSVSDLNNRFPGRAGNTDVVEQGQQALLSSLVGRSSKSAKRTMSQYFKTLSDVDAARNQVEKARRAADESLNRAKAAPRPHEITNPAFVALFEAHQHDREVLFAAMRAFDRAQEVLRVESEKTGNSTRNDSLSP
jgi:flagellar biosynthesis/type III secretory pathway chaperone